jgi:WD40 repeat protein
MHTALAEHPKLEQLAAFRQGSLDEEELAEIENHLADCAVCCRSLQTLPDDSFLLLVRKSFDVPPLPVVAGENPGPLETRIGVQAAAAARRGFEVPPDLAAHPRYDIVELLGSGGMGTVYRAQHRLMERLVALKVIRHDLTSRPAVVERFGREVKAAACLTHPNIVTGYDAERAGNTHFLVMEFVAGITLARLVDERGPLPAKLACDYVRQAALGLQHALEHGMVHRDIKPHNLMLTPQGQIKILDFGLARFAREILPAEAVNRADTTSLAQPQAITGASATLGTVDYMAPEQADDPHQADIRADIYSLGCTLYFLLTGRPVFPVGTITEKLEAHARRSPDLSTGDSQGWPAGLARVLGRMLAKGPAERFQTPGEVATALEPQVPQPGPSRRRSWRLVVAGALLAVLGLVGWWFAPAVYRIATNQGQLRIVVDDPEVDVVLGQQGVTVHDRATGRTYVLKQGDRNLPAGRYEIQVSEAAVGLRFSTREFTLERGRVVRVHVTFAPPARALRAEPVGEIRRLVGHTLGVFGVGFSPDSQLAFSAGVDGSLRLWDLQTGRELRQFTGHTQCVQDAAFSPDARLLLSCGNDTTLRLWDVKTGKEIRQFRGHSHIVHRVAFDPKGKRALSGCGDGTMLLWDVESGKKLRCFAAQAGWVVGVAFSPDGRLALSGHQDGTARLWEVASGKQVKCFQGHTSCVTRVAFVSASRILSASHDGTVRLWDVATGEEIHRFAGHTGAVDWVAAAADGRRILSGGADHTVRLWDTASGKQLYSFTGHSCALSTDGLLALSGGRDRIVRLYRMPEQPLPIPGADKRRFDEPKQSP